MDLMKTPSRKEVQAAVEHDERVMKRLADRVRFHPAAPTVSWQRCWACVEGYVDDGKFDTPQSPVCPICHGKGELPYEVR